MFSTTSQKSLGECYPALCGRCHNQVYMHLIKVREWVSVFGFRVIPYLQVDYFTLCPICHEAVLVKDSENLIQLTNYTNEYLNDNIDEAEYLTYLRNFANSLYKNDERMENILNQEIKQLNNEEAQIQNRAFY